MIRRSQLDALALVFALSEIYMYGSSVLVVCCYFNFFLPILEHSIIIQAELSLVSASTLLSNLVWGNKYKFSYPFYKYSWWLYGISDGENSTSTTLRYPPSGVNFKSWLLKSNIKLFIILLKLTVLIWTIPKRYDT